MKPTFVTWLFALTLTAAAHPTAALGAYADADGDSNIADVLTGVECGTEACRAPQHHWWARADAGVTHDGNEVVGVHRAADGSTCTQLAPFLRC